MPREACHHILRVKCVEVCRAQDLTEEQVGHLGIPAVFGRYNTAKSAFLRMFFNHPAHKKMELDMYTPNWVWYIEVEGVGG